MGQLYDSMLELAMNPGTSPIKNSIPIALVVEDDPLVRFVMREALEDLGLEVHEAEDGEKGLALLLDNWSIGVVVTDISMPRLDGPAMLARAREARRDFIAVTTSGQSEAPKGEVFLRKPFRAVDLQAKITQMLKD